MLTKRVSSLTLHLFKKSTKQLFSTQSLASTDDTPHGVTSDEERSSGRLVPGKPYRNIDTRVKHLQHMTSEDLSAPDKLMLSSEMKDLILEARDKIKPVIQAMPEEELKAIILTLDEAKKDHQIIIHRPEFYQVLEKIGITLEELRKI